MQITNLWQIRVADSRLFVYDIQCDGVTQADKCVKHMGREILGMTGKLTSHETSSLKMEIRASSSFGFTTSLLGLYAGSDLSIL